ALLGRPASPLPDGRPTVLAHSSVGPAVEVQATPDSEPAPPEPFPQRRRREQLAQLGVDRWHAAGFRGQGITIAVLDTGFRGYRQHLGHALPAHVRTRSFRPDGNLEARNSQHGVLCAEVLHALAPDAQILLANWDTGRPQSFLDAARWARSQGARIISCSVIMPSWSDGQGGGRVDTELGDILGSGQERADMLFFASAGNTAQRHWSGSFHDDGDGWHEWQPGVTRNALSPWGTEAVSVELYGRPGSEYEIEVLDTTTGQTVAHGRSRRRELGRCCGVARFHPQLATGYEVRVRLVEGPGGPFHLVALGGGLECHTAPGSVACPADCPQVLAVGAIHRDGHRASYSSCGSFASMVKPDLVATIPFASLWRPAPFSGTSAAAPQAAGLAALCWSRHPSWTAADVRRALRHAARTLSARAPNPETGYGLIRLPAETVADSGGRKPITLRQP
ncbi:MAG TPA: S8 family serine peptidase, partial [Gemmataceae bacterium]|nr:S8 family serine peptidase [Gemmataceae bacterium]